jgi:hypothetical protein
LRALGARQMVARMRGVLPSSLTCVSDRFENHGQRIIDWNYPSGYRGEENRGEGGGHVIQRRIWGIIMIIIAIIITDA